MFKYLRFISIFTFVLVFWGNVRAQDPAFSQFYANPLFLNPALAGATECGRLNLNYRNQWPAMGNAFITYGVSYDQNIESIKSGFGIVVMSDRQGDGALTRSSASLFYSYKLKVSDPITISFGVEGTFLQDHLDWNKLQFADQFNIETKQFDLPTSETPPSKNSVATPDFSVGAVMNYYDEWFAGVAVNHITQPDISFYDNTTSKLAMKYTVHGGVNVNLSKGMLGNFSQNDYLLQVNLLYLQQESFNQINAGLYINKYPFVLGGWFRHNFSNPDAAIVLVGVTWKNLRFGYSYDFTVSKIGGSSGGAHEISFSWDFCIYKQQKRRTIRAIKAPMF
jgi:type IX secretion system PorP/SprF family membrane protein